MGDGWVGQGGQERTGGARWVGLGGQERTGGGRVEVGLKNKTQVHGTCEIVAIG